MHNKKVLSKIDLGSYIQPNPYKNDIIYDPRGQWDHPGQNTRIPGGDITMQNVPYPVWAQPNVGPGTMMQPEQDYNFPGADYVDEYPQMKKGGTKKKSSKYTRNIFATNKLFVEGPLFKKAKKYQIFDPNASFYQNGGSISFDYDDTFSTDEGLEMAKDNAGSDMYIVSARPYVTEDMIQRAERAGIPSNRIFATGSDEAKLAKIKELGIGTHIDNKKSVIKKLGSKGRLFQEGGASNNYIELDLTPEEIEQYRKGGYIVEDISVPSLNRMQDGNEVNAVTAPQGSSYDWGQQQQIINPGNVTPVQQVAPVAPVQEIAPEVIPAPTPVVAPVVEPKQTSVTNDPIPVKNSVMELQKKLKAAGYDLGNYGPNKDGIDGQLGNRTKLAQDAFEAGIPPSQVKVPDPKQKVKGQTNDYTINTNLKDGYLPYLGIKEEYCTKDKGCSANVSIKMSNLLGNITDDSLWANDAWFNKSEVINKGGDLIYENNERDVTKMQKVPKDVYSKLQVGDYVQLNRADSASSERFAAQTKAGLTNEGIEHLGFIVGKDKDGTPLVWHGSEKGKAFIQRIDQPIVLNDHDKNKFTYQVSSIVRSSALKDADFSGLQNSPYYTVLDPKKKLVVKPGATETQTEAVAALNKSANAFKTLGYSQDDANYVGRLLIGGIMSNESKGGEDWKVVPKQIAATIWKDYLGQGEFKGDEASVGYYQMKPHYNFTNQDGSLNPLGKKLQKLGVSVGEITSGNIEAQTKAGTLILLNNYENLKKDPDFNVKTGLYKGKIPASYILAKSWQAGEGWYKRDKYKKFLDDFDIDYSNAALKKAVNTVDSPYASRSMTSEYDRVVKYKEDQRKANLVKEQAEKAKRIAEEQKKNPNAVYSKRVPTESTSVYNPYKDSSGIKPFSMSDYTKKSTMQSTVYKYPGRPGVTYKKDSNGKWYINTGKSTGNQYVAMKDPSGDRAKALSKGAVKAKEGGIVTNLTQAEINEYIKNGYVVEQVD